MIKRVYKEKAFSLRLNENEVLWNRAKGFKFWRKELWIKNKINLNRSSTEIILKTGVHFNATISNPIDATYVQYRRRHLHRSHIMSIGSMRRNKCEPTHHGEILRMVKYQ
jgi:hypothetical protein